uniref:Thioredoxin domain-containing protein n=1 Tax=Craspedostauros australis TaxID=1486917 RepID=A0A7R9ZQU5_9STRA|mmetsp:Transcript_6231/g.16934  ORF Transcript_6231/g.16934 Transcript_6231/m.16934 type:complete len:196 (+) Transcript_6231:922-1509(+)
MQQGLNPLHSSQFWLPFFIIPLGHFPMVILANIWYIHRCTHCMTFATQYSGVARTFHSSPEEGIRVAKVDANTERALGSRFSIHSYPSFFIVDGMSVYEFKQSRSPQALMTFARGGYKSQKPLTWYTSPMGPIGLLQGLMIYSGSVAMDTVRSYKDSFNLSPFMMGMLICGAGVVGTLFLMVVFVMLIHVKEKYE